MLSASAHILARLQRCNQTRRLLDSKLARLINRAITLREAGKISAAAEVEKDIAAYLERQKELGRTTDQAIAALHRALRQDLKSGTLTQKAQTTNQVARTTQKAVKAKIAQFLAAPHATAITVPAAFLLTLLAVSGVGSQAATLAAGFHCYKTTGVRVALAYCHQKAVFPLPTIVRKG